MCCLFSEKMSLGVSCRFCRSNSAFFEFSLGPPEFDEVASAELKNFFIPNTSESLFLLFFAGISAYTTRLTYTNCGFTLFDVHKVEIILASQIR